MESEQPTTLNPGAASPPVPALFGFNQINGPIFPLPFGNGILKNASAAMWSGQVPHVPLRAPLTLIQIHGPYDLLCPHILIPDLHMLCSLLRAVVNPSSNPNPNCDPNPQLRYPGGTVANYWFWPDASFINPCKGNAQPLPGSAAASQGAEDHDGTEAPHENEFGVAETKGSVDYDYSAKQVWTPRASS